MPYLDAEDKIAVDQGAPPRTGEQLTYVILRQVFSYLKNVETGHVPLTGLHIAEVMNACDIAKLEFWRRIAVPFMEKHQEQSGDVFPEDLLEEAER